MRLDPDRGMRRLQLLLGARQLDRGVAFRTRGPGPRHGDFRIGQSCIRHGRLSASGKRPHDQQHRNQASRKALLRSPVSHAVCSPRPHARRIRQQG
jgi:hypothetical protein